MNFVNEIKIQQTFRSQNGPFFDRRKYNHVLHWVGREVTIFLKLRKSFCIVGFLINILLVYLVSDNESHDLRWNGLGKSKNSCQVPVGCAVRYWGSFICKGCKIGCFCANGQISNILPLWGSMRYSVIFLCYGKKIYFFNDNYK